MLKIKQHLKNSWKLLGERLSEFIPDNVSLILGGLNDTSVLMHRSEIQMLPNLLCDEHEEADTHAYLLIWLTVFMTMAMLMPSFRLQTLMSLFWQSTIAFAFQA